MMWWNKIRISAGVRDKTIWTTKKISEIKNGKEIWKSDNRKNNNTFEGNDLFIGLKSSVVAHTRAEGVDHK